MMTNTATWWAPSIRATSTIRFPGGQGRLSPVDPRDIAAAACAVLTQPGHHGHAYDVTGPELLTIADMVAILARVLGREIQYIDVPETEIRHSMTASGAQANSRAHRNARRHPGQPIRPRSGYRRPPHRPARDHLRGLVSPAR